MRKFQITIIFVALVAIYANQRGLSFLSDLAAYFALFGFFIEMSAKGLDIEPKAGKHTIIAEGKIDKQQVVKRQEETLEEYLAHPDKRKSLD